jgi:hypothetical protein
MNTGEDRILDGKDGNAAFHRELEVMCREHPCFRSTYREIRDFFHYILWDGVEQALLSPEFRKIIRNFVVLYSSSHGENYDIYKFCASLPSRRRDTPADNVWITFAVARGYLVPLTIFQHGDKQAQTPLSDLKVRFARVLTRSLKP